MRAFAIIHAGPALWIRREYLIKGDRVLAFEDSTPDSKAPAIGGAVRALERL